MHSEHSAKIKPECDRFGMPLMIEPLVFQSNAKAGGYMVDGDLDKILPLVRQAVELGADIIKADPTDDVSVYHKVVEIAGRRFPCSCAAAARRRTRKSWSAPKRSSTKARPASSMAATSSSTKTPRE